LPPNCHRQGGEKG